MDIAALLNSAITFAVIMGIFYLLDRATKGGRFHSKSWKFWVTIFIIYMVITYVIGLMRG